MHAQLWFDGSYDWKKRTASGGAVVWMGGKNYEFTWKFGETTMNGCEFMALKNGIETARNLGATSLSIRGDSKLVVKCVKGEWRAKLPHIRKWRDEIVAMLKTIPFDLCWIPREQNLADDVSR